MFEYLCLIGVVRFAPLPRIRARGLYAKLLYREIRIRLKILEKEKK